MKKLSLNEVENMNKVGVHNGVFHADDAFAVAFVKIINPNIEVVRSRGVELLDCGIMLDVQYEGYEGKCLDHHTDLQYRANGIPYAAFGLLWREIGMEYLSQYSDDIEEVGKIFTSIDEQLVQGIDALDNGVNIDTSLDIMNVSRIISLMNPTWDSEESSDAAFDRAIELAKSVFKSLVDNKISTLKAKEKVRNAYIKRKDSQVVILDEFLPWTEALLEVDNNEEVKLIIYPSKPSGYRVQVVPKELGSFDSRIKLPESWAGLRGTELCVETSVSTAVFCHPGRFIAGAETLEDAIKLANLALCKY